MPRMITGRIHRHGLGQQTTHFADGFSLSAFLYQSVACRRARQHFQADFQQHAQRTVCANHQTRDIVARHVFYHLPTEAQYLALAIDQLAAQYKIACGAAKRTTRPGQTAGNGATQGGVVTKMRRLECQHLPGFCQRSFNFLERRAATCSQNQLARIMFDDAAMAADIQNFAVRLSS